MNKSDFFTADAVKPHFTYDDYCESADMIAAHLGDFRPEVLLDGNHRGGRRSYPRSRSNHHR